MSKQLFLVLLLRRRGLYYSVWFENKGCCGGWMFGSHAPGGFRRLLLGGNFFGAVEMIASGGLDWLKDKPCNVPTEIAVAFQAPPKGD